MSLNVECGERNNGKRWDYMNDTSNLKRNLQNGYLKKD